MEEYIRRTWARIDLDAVTHNIRTIKAGLAPGVKLCAVVKADCYGHGYEHTAAEMAAAGADFFAVSNVAEALQLRRTDVREPILILGYTPPELAPLLSENGVSQAVFSLSYAKALSEAAVLSSVQVKTHIKVDTGMSRIGFPYRDPDSDGASIEEIAAACRLPGLSPEGIFTHFSCADTADGEAFTRRQFSLFTGAAQALKARGVEFRLRHCANSAGILRYPETQLDMVRAGIILYGLAPSPFVPAPELKPVMSLKTVISMVKTLPAGTPVSYGGTWVSDQERRIATVPIGYADGYPRSLSSKGGMLVNGMRAGVVGSVCMDQCMLDVTGVPDVREGQTVTVFGADGGRLLSVEQVAGAAGVIPYEIVCGLSRRVPRVYVRGGRLVHTTDYMLN